MNPASVASSPAIAATADVADEALAQRLREFSQVTGLVAIILGLVVLAGWAAHLSALTSVVPGLSTMKPNTAVCFVLCGASLWLRLSRTWRLGGKVASALAAMVMTIGALTLFEYVSGLSIGIDQWLLRDDMSTSGVAGRMGPNTALCFVLNALALLLLNSWPGTTQFLTLASFSIALIALVGYAYSVQVLYGVASYTQMAIHTAAGLAVLGLGITTVHSRSGVMRVMTSLGPGGILMRTMLPVVVLSPLVLGWLRLSGQRAGWYGTELGVALLATSSAAVFAVVMWLSANRLDRAGRATHAALRDVADRNNKLEREILGREHAEVASSRLGAIVESSDDAIIGKDLNGGIASWNQGATALFGYTADEMVGASIRRLIPEERQEEEAQILEKITHGEQVTHFETQRLAKDGRLIDVSITSSPIKDATGRIIGASHVARDITERKQTEETLRVSRELLTNVSDSPPSHIFARLKRLLITIQEDANQQHLMEVERKAARNTEFCGMIGGSPAMLELFDLIRRLAPHARTGLITGETGSGKELVALALCKMGPRRQKPFVVVNCSAVVETLFESELFGHTKGAFTGATENRTGFFESADGGTLFLDEIGELPLALQAKLLRVLDSGEIQRVGATAKRRVDVNVIAATNRHLPTEVAAGRFRSDLFYRLNLIELVVPPLRERQQDIPNLAAAFVGESAARLGKDIVGLTPSAEQVLKADRWEGNVRELRHAIERACILADGQFISERELSRSQPLKSTSPTTPPSPAALRLHGLAASTDEVPLSAIEREHIAKVLERAGGNKITAARLLGVDRRALYRRLERYGLGSISRRPRSKL